MFSSQSAELSLNIPCRATTAVTADRVDNRFLVGSSKVVPPPVAAADNDNHAADDMARMTALTANELHAVRFHSDINELGLDGSVTHPTGPVHCMASSPTDATLVATSTLAGVAKLWKLPHELMEASHAYEDDVLDEDPTGSSSHMPSHIGSSNQNKGELQELSHIDGIIADMAWKRLDVEATAPTSPSSVNSSSTSAGDLITVDRSGHTVQLWDVEFEKATSAKVMDDFASTMPRRRPPFPKVAWDPHTPHAAAVTHGSSVRLLDWRTSNREGLTLSAATTTTSSSSFLAHRSSAAVVDLDYNPNKPYVLATAGTDGTMHVWDCRATAHQTLLCRGAHRHWISTLQYNPFHDQLVVSTGTDSLANLWRISSPSSAPLLDETDARVQAYEHADAVYGAAWGNADAWVYLTVGYEGKAVLHHVPSKEKYLILL